MSSIRPTGPQDPSPIHNAGISPGTPAASSTPGAFKLPGKQAPEGVLGRPASTETDPIVQRVKDRLAAGGEGMDALTEIVELEISSATGKPAPKAMVAWVSETLKSDPEMARVFARMGRETNL